MFLNNPHLLIIDWRDGKVQRWIQLLFPPKIYSNPNYIPSEGSINILLYKGYDQKFVLNKIILIPIKIINSIICGLTYCHNV